MIGVNGVINVTGVAIVSVIIVSERNDLTTVSQLISSPEWTKFAKATGAKRARHRQQ